MRWPALTFLGAWRGWAAALASTVPIPRLQLTVKRASVAVGSDANIELLEALCAALEKQGKSFKDTGITGIFWGGTEFTPQFTRFCVEEYFGGHPDESGIYMTPTYGNTLMGLACSRPVTKEEGYKMADEKNKFVDVALARPITDDPDMLRSIVEVVKAVF